MSNYYRDNNTDKRFEIKEINKEDLDVNSDISEESIYFSKMAISSLALEVEKFYSNNIHTIKDFITCSPEAYPGPRREIYVFLANIFKHEYLGESLIFDNGLLEKKYSTVLDADDKHFRNFDYIFDDIRKLFPAIKGRGRRYFERLIKETSEKSYFRKGLNEYIEYSIDMLSIIKKITQKCDGFDNFLAYYYLYYIEKKKVKDEEKRESSDEQGSNSNELDELIATYKNLVDQRNDLNTKIDEVVAQIHGKKGGNIAL